MARKVRSALGGFAVCLALAAPVRAAETTTSHAVTTFGDAPKYTAGFRHFDYVNPDAPKGGEMSIGVGGTFDNFNPYTVDGVAAALSNISTESLMEAPADEIGALYCLICSTVEYPADRAWAIFTLRPEAKFSDGSPIAAEDVVFTHDLFMEQGLESFRAVTKQFIEKAEVVDAQHVKFTFKPDSKVRERLQSAGGLPVMSKAWFDKAKARLDKSRMEPALGSGPYLVDSYDIGKRVVYKRNPDYWGKDLPNNIGRYNFDKLRVEYFGDPTAMFEAFKAGEYLFRNENSAKNWATGYTFPAITNNWMVKAELPNGNIGSGQSFVFNLRREKFQDPRVREALGLMFNFEWSNKTLFYGLYTRTNSFWDNSDLAATGKPSAEELAVLEPFKDKLPAGVLEDDAVMAPVSGDAQLDRKNLRKASALLDEAGWAVGDDGIRRNARGETLRVGLLESDPAFDRVIAPYVENLKALGVDAAIDRVDPAQYELRSRKFDFDMVNESLGQGFQPGAELQQYFGSTGVNDVFNQAGVNDPVVDGLITQIMQADSNAELKVRTHALDRVLRAMRFWVPQWYKNTNTVAYWDLYEHPETLPPYSLGQLDFWWYNAEKADSLKATGALR
jgi:microcin C transport system substrate-binding protein